MGSTGLANALVTLFWTTTPGVAGYHIWRSQTPGTGYEVVGSSATPAYTDTTVTNGATYYYVITTTNIVGDSAWSSQASAAPSAQAAAPLRILCIGDGNTAGYTDNPDWTIPFEFGYRSGLYLRMTTNGHPVQFVGDSSEPWSGFFGLPTNTPSPDLRLLGQDYHRGYAGLNTSHVLSYISNWLVVDDPDIILLLIGLDDPDINVTRSNLTHILQTIATNQPHASTIVAQIPPLAYYTQIIVDLNNFIRDTLVPAFQAQGNRVGTVDQYAHLLTGGVIDPSLFANQLNHPGNMAFDHMAQTWYVGIQAALTAPSLVRFTRVSSSGGNVVLAGSGGPADTRFHMLTSTNPALPASSWQTNSPMGTFDSSGNFTYTNALNLNRPGRFFRIKSQ